MHVIHAARRQLLKIVTVSVIHSAGCPTMTIDEFCARGEEHLVASSHQMARSRPSILEWIRETGWGVGWAGAAAEFRVGAGAVVGF
jgi:hypothetical protein